MCLRWRGVMLRRAQTIVLLNSIVQDIITFALGPDPPPRLEETHSAAYALVLIRCPPPRSAAPRALPSDDPGPRACRPSG